MMIKPNDKNVDNVVKAALFLEKERVKTFKNWPFDDNQKCNVSKMAEAGFYSIATGDEDADTAKCFLCNKELDGWEADDDPWSEHKSHAAQCAFVQIGKQENDLKMHEMVSLFRQFMANRIMMANELIKTYIDERAS